MASGPRDNVLRIRRIDEAVRRGDLDALRVAVEDPAVIPGGQLPPGMGSLLVYAIYHAPLPFVKTLLERGADPNMPVGDGFPPLIAALTCLRDEHGAAARPDALDLVSLLLAAGADPDQRGINDWTALHLAVVGRSRAAVQLLLQAGPSRQLRTRIDDRESPLELARGMGLDEIAQLLQTRD